MLAREIMNTDCVVCLEDASLEKVFEMMTERKSDCVVVIESRAHCIPIGTITAHDICAQLIGKGRSPRGLTAANVMNTKIFKVSEKSDSAKCLELLKKKAAERLCVTDADGKFRGVLTRTEIEKAEAAKPSVENRFSKKTIQIYNAPGINRIF